MRRCNPALRYGLGRTSPATIASATRCISQRGVDVAPQIPTDSAPRTIRPAVRRPPRPDRCVHWRHGRPRRAPSRWRICGPKRKSPRRTAERKPPNVPRGWRPAGRSCRAPPPATHRPRGGASRRPAARKRDALRRLRQEVNRPREIDLRETSSSRSTTQRRRRHLSREPHHLGVPPCLPRITT